jgi:hypothetical protein
MLRMTDTMTFQNTDHSSWDILYIQGLTNENTSTLKMDSSVYLRNVANITHVHAV